MEEAMSDDTTRDRPVPGEPIRGASTATDKEDEELVYDRIRFWRDKVRRRYFRYYHRRRIIVERGAVIEEFDEHAPRVRAVLDAQGWTDMVEDHRPVIEEIVWEFYANLHQRCGDSFCTWIKGKRIKVTPASSTRSPEYLVYVTRPTHIQSTISPLVLRWLRVLLKDALTRWSWMGRVAYK